VDDLVKALGLDGISKSEVSRICGELGPLIEAFRSRRLTTEYPYLWLDATYHKVRIDGRVVSQATVVAIGVSLEGERQILWVDVGASEDRRFWTAFLRSLVKRGLAGVRLVIPDAHEGLKQAIGTVLNGAAWQRCRVQFMCNLLATATRGTCRQQFVAMLFCQLGPAFSPREICGAWRAASSARPGGHCADMRDAGLRQC
jgi:putative transposase